MDTLVRLTYFSTVHPDTNKGDLRKILKSSEKHNLDNRVSGVLYFNCEHFVQILEGEREHISNTYSRIVEDKRHIDPILVGCTPVDSRLFGQWNMAFLADDQIAKRVFLETTGRSYFEPNVFSEEKLVEALTSITFQIADDLIFPSPAARAAPQHDPYSNAIFSA